MTLLQQITANQTLMSGVVGWTVAQVLKTLLDISLNRSFNPERLVGSGGMPSSHSATVCALTTAAGLCYGLESFEFSISFLLAMIVMYDAMNVRRETGEQSKILNQMIRQWMDEGSKHAPILADHKLKELVGHTPVEVLSGAAVGICMGLMIPIL